MNTRKLTTCALFVALAVVASLIRLYRFPFGGSVTLLSMLIITLPAWIYGIRTGVLCGLVFGIMQFVLDPCVISIPQLLLDYVLAFSVMGVGGIFKEAKHGLAKGYGIAVLARWIIATLAGLAWVAAGFSAWEGWNPLPYSMAYNGAYIFTEAVITYIIIAIPSVKKALDYVKKQANLQ